jgi:hypothetical protein
VMEWKKRNKNIEGKMKRNAKKINGGERKR